MISPARNGWSPRAISTASVPAGSAPIPTRIELAWPSSGCGLIASATGSPASASASGWCSPPVTTTTRSTPPARTASTVRRTTGRPSTGKSSFAWPIRRESPAASTMATITVVPLVAGEGTRARSGLVGSSGGVSPGVALEGVLAAGAAEVEDPAFRLEAMRGGGDLDDHPAHRILLFASHRGHPMRLLLRRRRLAGAAHLDDLGEYAPRDLLRGHGADVEPRRRLQAPDPILGQLPPPQALDDDGRPLAARDEADVSRSCYEHPFQRLLVRVAVRGDHDRRLRAQRQPRKLLARRVRADHGHGEVGGPSESGEGLDDGSVTHQHPQRLREERLHVDLQRAAAVARHGVRGDALGPARGRAALADQRDQARLAITERVQGLAHHDRLRARPAHPAGEAAVAADERLGARLGRGRTLAPDHGGQGERLAQLPQLDGEREEVLRHCSCPLTLPSPPRRGRGNG